MSRSLSCGEREILNQDRDDDAYYGPTPIRSTEHTARKAHACDGCDYGGILAGERYTQLVFTEHEDGGFKIERFCQIAGCNRSEEHLEWMLKDQERAMADAYRREDEEAA